MTAKHRDPFKDAKAVIEKIVADIDSADVTYALGYMDDREALAVLDLIERAEVRLRWGK